VKLHTCERAVNPEELPRASFSLVVSVLTAPVGADQRFELGRIAVSAVGPP